MKTNKPRYRILAAMLTTVAALGLVGPAHAYSVYRSVTANAVTGVVAWGPANFGVSGTPPTLSFFYFASDMAARTGLPAAQCFVKVDLANTNNPQPNDHDTVGNVGIAFVAAPADQPQPFPWTIVFDNNPPGHWSIARPQISTTGTNAAASRVASIGFNALATTGGSGVTIVNGTLGNCGP